MDPMCHNCVIIVPRFADDMYVLCIYLHVYAGICVYESFKCCYCDDIKEYFLIVLHNNINCAGITISAIWLQTTATWRSWLKWERPFSSPSSALSRSWSRSGKLPTSCFWRFAQAAQHWTLSAGTSAAGNMPEVDMQVQLFCAVDIQHRAVEKTS